MNNILGCSAALVAELNKSNIKYACFKSTGSISKALKGDQDIDLLVSKSDRNKFESILLELGGVRSTNNSCLTSPHREDWFLLDEHSGKFAHLDVHYSFKVGPKFLKCIDLFCYEDLKNITRVLHGVSCVSVNDELVVALSRYVFRMSLVSNMYGYITGNYTLDKGLNDEVMKLIGCELDGAGCYYLDFPHVGIVEIKMINNNFIVAKEHLAAIKDYLFYKNALSYKSFLIILLFGGVRKAKYYWGRFLVRFLSVNHLDRRSGRNGGLIVALVAPDGIGKSTQVSEIENILNWKFTGSRHYLGVGDGDGWIVRRFLIYCYKTYKRRYRVVHKKNAVIDSKSTGTMLKNNKIKSVLSNLFGLVSALEKKSSMRKIFNRKRTGQIVLCDRWPQNLVSGHMDGPSLPSELTKYPLVRNIKKYEDKIFYDLSKAKPDLLILLDADYSVSASRKPGELTKSEYIAKQDVMIQLGNKLDYRCVSVDAGQDKSKVTADILSAIWRRL